MKENIILKSDGMYNQKIDGMNKTAEKIALMIRYFIENPPDPEKFEEWNDKDKKKESKK